MLRTDKLVTTYLALGIAIICSEPIRIKNIVLNYQIFIMFMCEMRTNVCYFDKREM
jgi:hypothetical protein